MTNVSRIAAAALSLTALSICGVPAASADMPAGGGTVTATACSRTHCWTGVVTVNVQPVGNRGTALVTWNCQASGSIDPLVTTLGVCAVGGGSAGPLARPATLVRAQGHQMRDVTISGGGRVAGIVLAQEGADAASGAVLYAMRFNGCWARGCVTPRDERLFPWGYAETRNVPSERLADGTTLLTLPAGRYTAYVVADGAPVTVTVRFSGARGSGRLRPDRAASLRLATATSQVPGGTVYSAGAAGELRSRLGLLVGVMEARLTMNVSNNAGTCFYRDAQPPAGTFVAGCPFGSSEPAIVVNGVTPMHRGVTSMRLEEGDRDGVPWTLGNYVSGAYAAEWMSPSVFLWLDLD